MFKLLGHFLALAAMTASVLNAQCAVSCSLHSNTPSPSSETGRSDHSCCPHKGAPAPTQQKDGDPCHHSVAAADEVRLKNSGISFSSIPLAIVVGWSYEYGPQFPKTHLDPPAAPDSTGLLQALLISILRV
jgi:hypothetical protein